MHPHGNSHDAAESHASCPPPPRVAVRGGTLPPPSSPHFFSYFVFSVTATRVTVTESRTHAAQTPKCRRGGRALLEGGKVGAGAQGSPRAPRGAVWSQLSPCVLFSVRLQSRRAPHPHGGTSRARPGRGRAEPTAPYAAPIPHPCPSRASPLFSLTEPNSCVSIRRQCAQEGRPLPPACE